MRARRRGSRLTAGTGLAPFASPVLVGVLLAGCTTAVERVEVLRVPSPDATLDAVVVRTAAGATTSSGYFLFLGPRGCPATGPVVLRVVGATLTPQAAGVGLTWSGPRSVVVSYLEARFTDPDGGGATAGTVGGPVTVTTRPGSPDPSAPPGEMPARPGPVRPC